MIKKLFVLLFFTAALNTFAFNLTRKELPNGLQVLFIENHAVPLVTIKIISRNGAFVESDEFDGLSHLYEHMFFKANKFLPSQEEWIKYTRTHGMDWNGATSTAYVNYYFTVHKKNLLPGLTIMNNSIRFPLFDRKELKKEIKVVLSEYDISDSEPTDIFHREILRKAYGKYFSYKNVLGSRKIVQTATREKLLKIKNRFYVPENCLLIIAGDIVPGVAFEKVKKIFSDWKKGTESFKKPLPQLPRIKKNKYLIFNRDVKLSTIKILFNGPGVSTNRDMTYAADLLSSAMGHLNSKFHKSLVETGIAQSAAFWYYTQKVYGEIYFYMKVKPENIKKAMKALKRQIRKMRDLKNYLSKDLISGTLTMLEIEELYSRESAMRFSDKAGFWWSVSDIDYYLDYLSNIKRVKYKDMQKFFDVYVKGKPFIGGILISPGDQKKYGIDEGVFKWLN